MSKKYFINNLDTTFGKAMLSELVQEQTQDPVHMCTYRVPVGAKPNGIKKILKRQKPKLFAKKAIEECDVFVYNLDQTDISDIDFGIEIINKPSEDNKVFILVSDIMAWSNSGKKVKPDPQTQDKQQGQEGQEGQEKEAAEQQQQENEQPVVKANPSKSSIPSESKKDIRSQKSGEQNQDDDAEKEQGQEGEAGQQQQEQKEPVQYTFYEDTDYEMRVPAEKYRYIKQIEDKVLAVKKQNVKVFIVCPGVVYGCGQDTFYSLFKAAWLQQPSKLPYLNSGENLVPTIHQRDLVKFVIKLAQQPPEEGSPYLLAFDEADDRSQKCIVSAISAGIGSGYVESVQETPLIQNVDRFKLDIDIKPSKFFVGTQEQPVQFQWVAKKGIKQNIKHLLKDFCQKESLRPIKLALIQNERQWTKESKVEYILKTFSSYYRIPTLTIHQILQYARQFAQGDLLEDLNDEWDNITEYLKSGNPAKRGLDETMKVFYRVVRWRLLRNDCMNRGYILENFPNFRTELEYIFNRMSIKKFKRKVPKKKVQVAKQQPAKKEKENDDGEQDEQDQQKEQEQAAVGDQQAEKQPEQEEQEQEPEQQDEQAPKIEPFYPETLISVKRMGTPDDATLEVIQFFTSKGMEEMAYDTTGKKQNDIFQSLRSHIERNGRPNNYLVDQRELLSKYKELLTKENKQCLQNRQKRQKQQEQHLTNVERKRKQLAKEIVQLVQNEGQEQIKKMPFRNYLMEFVVPTLNQGLLEVSNIIPNDPVDLLAEYLYQKSYDV